MGKNLYPRAPLLATSSVLFTLAGAGPSSISSRFVHRTRFCEVADSSLCVVAVLCAVVWNFGRERSISQDTLSGIFGCGICKASRLKAQRWLESQRGQYRKTVVDNSSTASREIGRNISFRCAFFGIYGFLLPLVVLVVSNRNLCAQVFFLFFISSPNPRKNSHWRMVGGWGWNAVQKFVNRERVPLRTRVTPEGSNPGEIESSSDRIGEGYSLSLSFSS